MIKGTQVDKWQQIGWNGLCLHIPVLWQPTAIHPAYLFFEQDGQPVLEIKWQKIQGRFSAEKIFSQLKNSLKNESRLESWAIPPDLQKILATYTVSGFRLHINKSANQGLILFCPECHTVTLLQWYFDAEVEPHLLAQLFGSFQDHCTSPDQLWSLYDIRALLPCNARLRSHEFLPGRYTLCFDIDKTTITLYRFKPATVLLNKKSIGTFGMELVKSPPVEEKEKWASWSSSAQGLELLLAKARRKPVWHWMRLWHDQQHNGILGVKAEGKPLTETALLERICTNYIYLDAD